jgi:putative ABC transport system permease protein
VEAVSRVGTNPFNSWGGNWSFDFEGQPMSFERIEIDSTFFRLFGVTYEPTGADPRSQMAIYTNRPGYNALRAAETDNAVTIGGNQSMTVVGVLSDFNFRPLQEAQGLLMMHESDNLWTEVFAVKVAAGGDLGAVSERVAGEYAAFAGNDRFEWTWADDEVWEFYERERRTSRIMAAFTALVMLIMFMGIFAMSIYILRGKEKEIAIRKVNGSTIGEVLALLGRQSVVSVAVAFCVAVPAAWWAMTRWLEGFPYRVGVAWWVFVAAGAAVLAITFACVGWQSWRAASANPVKSLKAE